MRHWTYVGEAAALREAAQRVIDAWDGTGSVVRAVESLRAALGPRPRETRYSWTADYYDKGEK